MTSLLFSEGNVIFRQDELQTTMYDILAGSVGVYTDFGTDTEKQIAVLNSGQLLGELGVIEGCPRSATAVALEDETTLNEITEEELLGYLDSKPDLVLKLLRQLSSRIRETNQKFYDACRTLREQEDTFRSGREKSEELTRQLEELSREAQKQNCFTTGLQSSFYRYVLDDIEEYGSKGKTVKASLLERLTIRSISPEEMHANPDDEFSKPSVGPNDRIINDYVKMVSMLYRSGEEVFPDPVIVQKLSPEGYLIQNGHHRWAAALKTGVDKLRAQIVNV